MGENCQLTLKQDVSQILSENSFNSTHVQATIQRIVDYSYYKEAIILFNGIVAPLLASAQQAISLEIKRLCVNYSITILLSGSYSRGTPSHYSDIDLVGVHMIPPLYSDELRNKIKIQLSNLLDRKVSVLFYDVKSLEKDCLDGRIWQIVANSKLADGDTLLYSQFCRIVDKAMLNTVPMHLNKLLELDRYLHGWWALSDQSFSDPKHGPGGSVQFELVRTIYRWLRARLWNSPLKINYVKHLEKTAVALRAVIDKTEVIAQVANRNCTIHSSIRPNDCDMPYPSLLRDLKLVQHKLFIHTLKYAAKC